MECMQQQTKVTVVKTLYENFLEEKCESDLLIPDYYPAAEKIILCHAVPIITTKEIQGDRLVLEGNCRFTVIYEGEDDGGIKAMSETVTFQESLPLKETGTHPWIQTMVRVAGTSCRLLNGRKISARATVSIAVKMKDQQSEETIEALDCGDAEALFQPISVYTVLDHAADTVKVQGELEVHAEILDVLKTDGRVCLKDVKALPGKVMIKGVLDLFILFTPEDDPHKVMGTSTAIPFTQVLELGGTEEGIPEAIASIQNIRTDVEADANGKNRLISVVATVLTEGELYDVCEHRLLKDSYSNRYPIELKKQQLYTESMAESGLIEEILRHEIPLNEEGAEVVQVLVNPLIQKITGQNNTLNMDGILDVSLFVREGEAYRGIDKSLTFTVSKSLKSLEGRMRCEVQPCVLGIDWSVEGETVVLKTEIHCSFSVFLKETHEVISEVAIDIDHPLEEKLKAPLIVYYGEKGERLWDIARKYATSVERIKLVNELHRDVLEDKKLLLISR